MNKINLNFDFLHGRSRYNLKQLRDFENQESVKEQKVHTTMILMVGFLVYAILTIYPCIEDYRHGVVTNVAISIVFILGIVHLRLYKNHISTTIIVSYALNVLLFFHFITETDWTIGMDAFWLFILIMPFITNYLAGILYGSVAALSGLILCFACFHTKMLNYLQPYGDNMVQWFTVIYIVVMIASAVIEYELTANQIDKQRSDEKLAYYQKERAKRLQRLLAVYESNEQTMRKYKHDIRHFNRVLAGFIQNKEYDNAAKYLQEFDSMLEEVTAVSFCDNKIVNELLSIYASRCQKMHFKLRVKAAMPEHIPMEETDLTSLVANALENAVEAQEHVEEDKRTVQVELTYDGRKLKLYTKNPCGVETNFSDDGMPISTRTVQSGIGTAQIKAIASKYGGVASFSQEKGQFVVKAVMTCI
jgi:hypothetical protein